MKYGRFDDDNREYVIETYATPHPWINYLGNERFFSLISNTAGGYCFYKDAGLRRILRYRYNNVPQDSNGRFFYICDESDYWNIGWQPVRRKLSFYECRHGLGYTRICGERNNIRATATYFVPVGHDAEIHAVTLRNNSERTRHLKLFSMVEFCLWNAYDDFTNYQRNLNTGEVQVHGSTIFHTTEYRERRNHYAYYAALPPIDGFDTDRHRFLGPHNGYDAPAAVVGNAAFNSICNGWSPIGSHQINVTLAPGQERELIFVLGYVENRDDAKWEADGSVNRRAANAVIEKFTQNGAVQRSLEELKDHWQSLLGKYTIESHDPRLDRMVNIWNPYQCMVTFNLSRSASYFEAGISRGIGFRDSNQDVLGFVHQIPDRARERILDLAATQFRNGGAYHQYQPLTKKGNHAAGSGFFDDPLWLILSTATYIKETGDWSILLETVPFADDPETVEAPPLMDHLRRSFRHVIEHLGPHGLPLIGRADWNDCLNLNCFSTNPDESFQTVSNQEGKVAESVFIAGLFVYAGRMYIELCKRQGLSQEADEAAGHIEQMIAATIAHGYDGDWFLRAYDAEGNKVGSHTNPEGQIYIEPQGMCVMAGIGVDQGLAVKALDAVQKHLETPHGIVLLAPAYSRYNLKLGEITSYPPGYKENGGIFCHNNPWVVCAETVIGRGDRAFEIYTQTTPAYIEENSDLHLMEPYVYAQMIAGKEAATPGQAKNSWLTGTAAWHYVAITQWVLGVKPGFDGLEIDPCIPGEWSGYTVRRHFRNAVYNIRINNPQNVSKGVQSITVDDEQIQGNVLPDLRDGQEHQVVVTMGAISSN